MSFLFRSDTSFGQDISSWDVSNVTSMQGMFWGAASFNQDIGAWDVRNVIRMDYMFHNAKMFNQDVSSWDVSNVTKMNSFLKTISSITFGNVCRNTLDGLS
ncbi:MAG: BspA family leucine-rich repeat surface protein [Anaerolineales bacterium]